MCLPWFVGGAHTTSMLAIRGKVAALVRRRAAPAGAEGSCCWRSSLGSSPATLAWANFEMSVSGSRTAASSRVRGYVAPAQHSSESMHCCGNRHAFVLIQGWNSRTTEHNRQPSEACARGGAVEMMLWSPQWWTCSVKERLAGPVMVGSLVSVRCQRNCGCWASYIRMMRGARRYTMPGAGKLTREPTYQECLSLVGPKA